MSNIKDRELMVLCDFMHLSVEHAKISYKDDVDDQIKSYTLFSLIKEEDEGLEKREKVNKKMGELKSSKENGKTKEDQRKEEIKDAVHKETVRIPSKMGEKDAYTRGKELNEVLTNNLDLEFEREAKIGMGINADKILGIFYDEGSKRYIYRERKNLRELAGTLMDYYDALKNDENNKNNDGYFLKEWKPVYIADNYLLARESYRSRIDDYIKQNQAFIEAFESKLSSGGTDANSLKALAIFYKNENTKLEKIKREFPTRVNALNSSTKKKQVRFAMKVLNNPFSQTIINALLGEILGNLSKKFAKANAVPVNNIMNALKNKEIEEVIKGMQTRSKIYDLIQLIDKGVFYGERVAGAVGKPSTKEEAVINLWAVSVEGKEKNSLLKKEFGFMVEENYDEEGLAIGVFQNDDKKTTVIAIRDDAKLKTINDCLNKGELPKEFFIFKNVYENILKDKIPSSHSIIITGSENAGLLANIIGVYFDIEIVTFFKNRPSNLKYMVDFDIKDIGKLDSKVKYMTSAESKAVGEGMIFAYALSCFTTILKAKSGMTAELLTYFFMHVVMLVAANDTRAAPLLINAAIILIPAVRNIYAAKKLLSFKLIVFEMLLYLAYFSHHIAQKNINNQVYQSFLKNLVDKKIISGNVFANLDKSKMNGYGEYYEEIIGKINKEAFSISYKLENSNVILNYSSYIFLDFLLRIPGNTINLKISQNNLLCVESNLGYTSENNSSNGNNMKSDSIYIKIENKEVKEVIKINADKKVANMTSTEGLGNFMAALIMIMEQIQSNYIAFTTNSKSKYYFIHSSKWGIEENLSFYVKERTANTKKDCIPIIRPYVESFSKKQSGNSKSQKQSATASNNIKIDKNYAGSVLRTAMDRMNQTKYNSKV